MANRFFSHTNLDLGSFVIEGAEAHHLADVRRHGIGDEVTLFNGDGKEYRAVVESIAKRQVAVTVVEITAPERELALRIHVASALPKGDRLDFLIEKLTELGVAEFTPLETERSVASAKGSKIEKLERAVIEASKQCGRNVLMRVNASRSVAAWCVQNDLPLRKWLSHPVGESIARLDDARGSVAVAIGPEGGFTEDEVSTACQCGFRPVNLGPRFLRIETAAIALATLLGRSQQ